MSFQLDNAEEILDKNISGFRKYTFGSPVTLTFVSQNLCDMTGYTKGELADGCNDLYAYIIHPADRHIYDGYLRRIATLGESCSAEYRIIKKDGSVLFVRDTMTVESAENGVCTGYSVLADITAITLENDNLRFLNDTVPCGMLKYTCDKNPKVTYVNQQMLNIMRLPDGGDGELDYLELCRDNIFIMIPVEERRRFSHFLDRVSTSAAPVAGELTVLRCDGTRARLYGWVTRVSGAGGKDEFQSVCMDVTERYNSKREIETKRYLKVLSDVYEKIFEYDFAKETVRYVSGISDTFKRIRNLPLNMEEATRKWIEYSVYHDDREKMHDFFKSIFTNRSAPAGPPPQIQCRVKSKDSVLNYTGIFLSTAPDMALFCCRKAQDADEADTLRCENISLRNRNESMQEMIMRYTDGIAAFEVTEDCVTPLYASDNVCEFFWFTKDEWLPLMKQSTSIKNFVSRSTVDYDKFKELLNNGEAEFTYYDISSDTEKRIKAICSPQHSDPGAPRYVMLYKMENNGKSSAADTEQTQIYIRSFGFFDVFVNDKPIAFRNKKAKELLALLVDRRGGYVTSEEAIGYLWEDEPVSAVTLARYRKEALRLKNTLEEYGVGYIMESVDGKRCVIPETFRCDLYDYLSGKEEYSGLFKGSYLSNYTWGETTLGELTNGKGESGQN